MHGWQAKKKSTFVLRQGIRAMTEKEKPPAVRVDIYYGEEWVFLAGGRAVFEF